MKEILGFITIVISLFKFFKNYFDFKKIEYYYAISFHLLVSLIFMFVLFAVDFWLFSKINYLDAICIILFTVEGGLFLFTVIMYGSTYRLAINHFVLYKDKKDKLFERISHTNPFNKETIKVKQEDDILEEQNKENRIYDYIDEYQLEVITYIDKDSNKYNEYVYEVYKSPFKRMSFKELKIKKYLWILPIIYLMTIALGYFFNNWIIFVVMIHILICIWFLAILIRIGDLLRQKNNTDKLKMMRDF
ncbi:hypothetical protein PYI52_10960 [Staphylococcus epidermidis]|uniref:hypothetical protein n=2 Tax=Staphylococcus TaxID=1279 RepID=UPI00029934FF|nr:MULTISPECIES: hypothetical protein [Staphylococcus]EKS26494.1 hypothetical protein HMPREF9281_02356 [Staphylococcus epidermidis BVS058A4]MBF2137974.1 hypothetical protein [Staphylococcus epidermidis]MBF2165504.1 hypothetical protein [Staphylococcus epidermidis]MBF2167817.1 hypothetical protein [Staphylococcus epidermidis]MBF2170126.1 hypothetical protein [Staphylococcus epidermidis]